MFLTGLKRAIQADEGRNGESYDLLSTAFIFLFCRTSFTLLFKKPKLK